MLSWSSKFVFEVRIVEIENATANISWVFRQILVPKRLKVVEIVSKIYKQICNLSFSSKIIFKSVDELCAT